MVGVYAGDCSSLHSPYQQLHDDLVACIGIPGNGYRLYDTLRQEATGPAVVAMGSGDTRVQVSQRQQPLLQEAGAAAATSRWRWDRLVGEGGRSVVVGAAGARLCREVRRRPTTTGHRRRS